MIWVGLVQSVEGLKRTKAVPLLSKRAFCLPNSCGAGALALPGSVAVPTLQILNSASMPP